jgi:hypothetical protein
MEDHVTYIIGQWKIDQNINVYALNNNLLNIVFRTYSTKINTSRPSSFPNTHHMNSTKSSKVLFHVGICEGGSKTNGIESLVFHNEEIKIHKIK